MRILSCFSSNRRLTPFSVVMFGAYNAHPNHPWEQAYKYVEKIQMTIFTLQEFLISGLYVWRTLDILKTSDNSRNREQKHVLLQLFSINVIIIVLDIALLVAEFQDRHVIEQALKGVVYSMKLKLEFAIPSKLTRITMPGGGASSDSFDDEHVESRSGSKVLPKSNVALGPFQPDIAADAKGVITLHIERAVSYMSGISLHGASSAHGH